MGASSRIRVQQVLLWAGIFVLGFGSLPAVAQSPPRPPSPADQPAWQTSVTRPPTQETWAGGQMTGNDWSAYAGATYALNGTLETDGWRLRTVGGYGRYRYAGIPEGQREATDFKGQNGFTDLLIGYRGQTGELTWKAFAGLSTMHHAVTPFDPGNAAIGNNYGLGTAVELWLNLSPTAWVSGAASYASVFKSYNATARGGYRLLQRFSVGLEAGIVGNEDHSTNRAAVFAAHEFGIFQDQDAYAHLSAGVSANRDEDIKPYLSLVLSLKY